MTEQEARNWGHKEAKAVYATGGHDNSEAGIMSWCESREDWEDRPENLKNEFYGGWEQGWKMAEAEAELTEDEIEWCRVYAKRMGLDEEDLVFDGDVWRGRVQQVTFVLKKREHFTTLHTYVDGVEQPPKTKSIGSLPELTMQLRKFTDSEDCKDGWKAFLLDGSHYSFLSSGKVKSTPAKAVAKAAKRLRKKAEKCKSQAVLVEKGLS